MAILEVVVSQTYANQAVINRFHYVSTGTPAAVSLSFALISAMGFLEATGSPLVFPASTLAWTMQNMQNNGVTYVSTAARDLYSDTDFYESPYPGGVTGRTAGEGNSPVLAFGLRSNRVRLSVRRGTKRIVGVTENASGQGGVIQGDFVTALANLADDMSEVLTYDDEGNTISFSPAVLSYESYETDSGNTAYRKRATEALQLEHAAVGVLWSPYSQVRSQVSRQYGRGI